MNLETYMRKNKLTDAKMGDLIKVKANSVYRYRKRRQKPDDHVLMRIYQVTDGLVTPNDFYDLPSPSWEQRSYSGAMAGVQ